MPALTERFGWVRSRTWKPALTSSCPAVVIGWPETDGTMMVGARCATAAVSTLTSTARTASIAVTASGRRRRDQARVRSAETGVHSPVSCSGSVVRAGARERLARREALEGREPLGGRELLGGREPLPLPLGHSPVLAHRAAAGVGGGAGGRARAQPGARR